MFCKNCGAKLADGVKFCPQCGEPAAQKAADLNSDSAASAPRGKISVDSNKHFVKNIFMAIVSQVLLVVLGFLFSYSLSGSDGELFGVGLSIFGGIMLVFTIVGGVMRASIEKMPMQHRLCKVIEKVGARCVIVEFEDGSRETFNVVKEIILSVGDVGVIGFKYKLITEYERK